MLRRKLLVWLRKRVYSMLFLKDVLIGVAVTWLTLTEDGKRFKKKVAKILADEYLNTKKEKDDNKDDA